MSEIVMIRTIRALVSRCKSYVANEESVEEALGLSVRERHEDVIREIKWNREELAEAKSELKKSMTQEAVLLNTIKALRDNAALQGKYVGGKCEELTVANARLELAEGIIEAAKALTENVRLGYGGPNTKACQNCLKEAIEAYDKAEGGGE